MCLIEVLGIFFLGVFEYYLVKNVLFYMEGFGVFFWIVFVEKERF